MIWKFRQRLVGSLSGSDAIDANGYITINTRYDADAICRESVYKYLPKCIKLRDRGGNFDPNIDLYDLNVTFKPGDLALLMFDRDYWLNKPIEMEDEDYEKQSHENYTRIVEKCLELNYTPVLSTPLFEFWLLLHHKDDFGDITEYPMDLGGSRKKIQKLLRKLEGFVGDGKTLSDDRKKLYGNLYPDALEVSKRLVTDPKRLIYESGTNIGVILMRLTGEGH